MRAGVLGLCLALLLGCSGMDRVLEAAGEELRPEPVPATHASYVGSWEGEERSLVVHEDGLARLTTHTGSMRSSVILPIRRWSEDRIQLGYFPVSRSLRIDAPPAEDAEGERWMTLDGERLRRVGAAPEELGGPPSTQRSPAPAGQDLPSGRAE